MRGASIPTDDVGPPAGDPFPTLPPGWVPRDRLENKITEGVRHPLTVVTGPPGSGKSVLLSGWAQRGAPSPPAWLSLDRVDNDPSWFRRHLLEAVHAVDPSLIDVVLEAVEEQQQSAANGPQSSLGAVARTPPSVLILDNFQVLTTEEVIDSVGYLVRRLPPHIHLVVCSRQFPSFPCQQLQASGQLLEVHGRDLRFTPEEAAAFFASAHTRPLAFDQVQALTERTEGWAAGLRLADLMSADVDDAATFVASFAGDVHLVADYFDHEVIDGEPADRVQFLLQTSVFDELTGPAGAAVTGRDDAEQLLDTLRGQHIFLNRLNTTAPSYRYHQLFLEFLRNKLEAEMPSVARESHLKAAAWFEDHCDAPAAVHHLVQAGAYDDAFELGVSVVVRKMDDRVLLDGQNPALTELPEEYFQQDPFRIYVLAAAYLCHLRLAEAASCLRDMDRASRDHPQRELLQGRAELLWTVRDGLLTDPNGVLLHYERATTLLGSRGRHESDPARPVRPAWLDAIDAVLLTLLPAFAAEAHLWLGEPQDALAMLPPRFRAANPSDDPAFLGVLARVAYDEGRLEDAARLAQAALDQAHRQDRAGSIWTLDGLLTLAAVLYERDDLAAAAARQAQARRLCAQRSQGHWRAVVGCEQARTTVAQGRAFEAFEDLRDLRRDELDDPLPYHVRQRLDQIEIRCRLALGDLDGALLILESVAAEFRTVETLARLDLAAGRPDRAADRLTADLDRAAYPRSDIERLLLLARAHLQLGDERRADDALGRAIDLGRPNRFIRVVLDETAELLGLLIATARRFPDAYLTELLSRVNGTSARPPAAPVEVLEPLTDRERELLGYLPSHLSHHEIAEVMYISLNTVKTHTKAVYRKLGAASRSEAVDLARAHGLIEVGVFTPLGWARSR